MREADKVNRRGGQEENSENHIQTEKFWKLGRIALNKILFKKHSRILLIAVDSFYRVGRLTTGLLGINLFLVVFYCDSRAAKVETTRERERVTMKTHQSGKRKKKRRGRAYNEIGTAGQRKSIAELGLSENFGNNSTRRFFFSPFRHFSSII